MTDWLKWDSFRPEISDEKPFTEWRASGSLVIDPVIWSQRLLAAEYLAIDDLLEAHEGKVTHVQFTQYPLTALDGDGRGDPRVTRRTSVMAGDVVLGSVVVRWTGEFRAEVVSE